MLLHGKVLIVSGIGPGLGVKLALEAAREGAAGLAISARTADKLDEAERRIKEANAGCQVLKQPTDIRDMAQCRRLADAVSQRVGGALRARARAARRTRPCPVERGALIRPAARRSGNLALCQRECRE